MCFYDKAGARKDCELLLRIDTETELNYCKAGGILNYVLGRIISGEL
jgi:aconitase (EC 4.2.1.3)